MEAERNEEWPKPAFEPLPEGRLAALGNEALVAYIGSAAEAGDVSSARVASGILAFGFEPTIRAWVRREMGSQTAEDVDDVVMDVLTSVVHSSFDGKLVGEFGSFLKTITKRRVIDYFRKRERRDQEGALPNEHVGEEGVWGEELGGEDGTGALGGRDAVERVLGRRNEMHRKVIRLYGPNYAGFMDLSAEETVEAIRSDPSDDTVTVSNVHQIWKRFKTDMNEELGLDD